MAIVYIPHKPDSSHIYDKAKAYGELSIIFEGGVLTHNTPMVEKVIKASLAGYRPEDFLILGGSRFILAVALAFVLGKHGRANILQYSSKNDKYDVYQLDLGLGRG